MYLNHEIMILVGQRDIERVESKLLTFVKASALNTENTQSRVTKADYIGKYKL